MQSKIIIIIIIIYRTKSNERAISSSFDCISEKKLFVQTGRYNSTLLFEFIRYFKLRNFIMI